MSERPANRWTCEAAKRAFDLVASGLGMVLLSPLYLLLALLVKLSSPGPFIFRQERVGRWRRGFQLVKFRTMRLEPGRGDPLVTAKGDSRITPVGGWLRRTKLDELPELWNVFRGDLSLVGPRPEVARYVATYKPEWEPVFAVKPGITDLATLQFRDEESVLETAQDRERAYIEVVIPIKMVLALEYVARRSFWLDLKILVLTVWSITLGRFFARPGRELALRAAREIETMNTSTAPQAARDNRI